jgi:hypothetical protein
MKRSSLTLLATSALFVTGALTSSPALAGSGHPPPGGGQAPRTIADGLVTPLSLAIDNWGRALVSENFAGDLLRISRDGTKTTIVSSPGDEVGAVSTHRRTTYYATTAQGDEPAAKLFAKRGGRDPQQIADLYAFESSRNPDQGTTYGFRDLDPACAAQFPEDNPASYTGMVDSHPYASLATRRNVYVADAGANAILRVKARGGTPKVVAVMPAVGTRVTAEALAAEGLPTCAAGEKYYFEFVPTDVERGRDGSLYVTSLPGGPEDDSLGARGAVYKVNPWNGHVRKVAGGFVGAVDLAIGPDGTIAVAELFGGGGQGQVTLFRPWSSWRKSLALTSPGAVEWVGSRRHSKLYVTTDAFVPDDTGAPQPIGKLQVLSFGSHRH